MQSERYWPDFCKALGLEHLINDQKFHDRHTRSDNAEELTRILDDAFAAKPYAEWEQILSDADILFSPIVPLTEVGNDPQALENQYIIEYDHPRLGKFKSGGFPIKFSKTACSVRMAAPEFGQHTEEILTEIGGYSWEEVSRFRDDGLL